MSGLEVVGGISAVIAIIDGTVKLWSSARKDLSLGETFTTVANRLPILRDTLQACCDHLEPIKSTLPAAVAESLSNTVKEYEDKAVKLHKIFETTIPGENDDRYERYRKIVCRLGKGSRVEDLMQSMVEATQSLVNYHMVKSGRPELANTLEKVIEDLQRAPPSLAIDYMVSQTLNAQGSLQNISTGTVVQYNTYNTSSGDTHNYSGIIGNPVFNIGTPSGSIEVQSFEFGLNLTDAPVVDPTFFVGRASELQAMEKILQPGQAQREHHRLALGGMGGVGKTQLAITYARRYCDFYKSIFWFNAASEVVLRKSMRVMAQRVLDTEVYQQSDDGQILLHVIRWLSDAKNTEWLLIFDNYDEPNAYNISEYCPYGAHGSTIITTRLPDQVQGLQLLLLPLDDIEQSLEILEKRSNRAHVRLDASARDLARRMQGLPLALTTAGTFLSKSIWSFERYLHEYELRWNLNPRRPLKLQEYQDRTLYTTWDVSYQCLHSEDAGAAQLLKLMAYFDNQHIWFELVHAGLGNDSPEWLADIVGNSTQFQDAMRLLVDYGFVRINLMTQLYSVHTCVHDWTLFGLNKDVSTSEYWYAVTCLTAFLERIALETFAYVQHAQLASHASRLVHNRFRHIRSKAPRCHVFQLIKLAFFLQQQSQIEAATAMFEEAMVRCEQLFGVEDAMTQVIVGRVGILYEKQGKLAEAEPLLKRASTGVGQAFGPDHPLTLDTLLDLATLFRKQGKLVEAEQLSLRVLHESEQVNGSKHKSTLTTMEALGLLYRAQGKRMLAEQMIRRCLSGCLVALGSQHPLTTNALWHQADLYADRHWDTEAEELYKEVLARWEKLFGPEHDVTLRVVGDLALSYIKRFRLADAEKMYLRILGGRQKAFDPMCNSLPSLRYYLATVYLLQGKRAEAERVFSCLTDADRRAVGYEFPDISELDKRMSEVLALKAADDRA